MRIRLLMILGISAQFIPARANVLTYHNDNARTGQNLLETILTPANVNSTQFGKLFTMAVDGKVDGQPLYVRYVLFPNKVAHSVVYVVTEHDSLYAFDANTAGAPLWQVSLLQGNETPSDQRGCGQVTPEIGITATPVIDLSVGPNGTMYVVAMSKNATGTYFQRLHALNLATGAEQFSGPVNVQATYPGTGDGSTGGNVVFDPKQYKSRPGLLLVNGTVYTSWGSHCDIRPYTGWTIAYNARTLAQTSVFNFAPNGHEAAIWASGAGPAADGFGNLYFQTANGTFDTALTPQGFPAKGDYGNSFVKLANANGKLSVLDYWTMYNSDSESSVDEDLGSGGVMLLPEQFDQFGQIRRLAVGAGKDRNVYVVDRDNMGKYDPTNNSNIYQSLPAGLSGPEFAMPAYFSGWVYFGAVGDTIRAFRLSGGRLSTTPSSTTVHTFPYPGTTPSISALGWRNGILWAVDSSSTAVLHAYDATNLARELYNSNQAGTRDQFGAGNKFITPTIANGKVYIGTQNSVAVFGLLK